MARVIGIIAIKGGVGKTTISSSLATELANFYKKKVLVIDANYSAPNLGLHMNLVKPEGTIHDVLAGRSRISSVIHNQYGVDVIPGSYFYNKPYNPLKLKDKISTLRNKYDFIILDSSPSLNEEMLSVILASDNLFVVTTPDYPTLSCSIRAARVAKQRDKPISGIIVNKIRDPKYELTLRDIEGATEIPVIARIFDDINCLRALFERMPVSAYRRKTKFSMEIGKLAATLCGYPEKKPFWRRFVPINLGREEVNRQLLKESFYSSIFSNGNGSKR